VAKFEIELEFAQRKRRGKAKKDWCGSRVSRSPLRIYTLESHKMTHSRFFAMACLECEI